MPNVVARSTAPNATEDSFFPNNLHLTHVTGCVIDRANYKCSCGLISHLLETGAFVKYEARFCPVIHTETIGEGVSGKVEEFLAALAIRASKVDMIKFRKD